VEKHRHCGGSRGGKDSGNTQNPKRNVKLPDKEGYEVTSVKIERCKGKKD